jgi:hypothetical protein
MSTSLNVQLPGGNLHRQVMLMEPGFPVKVTWCVKMNFLILMGEDYEKHD